MIPRVEGSDPTLGTCHRLTRLKAAFLPLGVAKVKVKDGETGKQRRHEAGLLKSGGRKACHSPATFTGYETPNCLFRLVLQMLYDEHDIMIGCCYQVQTSVHHLNRLRIIGLISLR